MALKQMSLARMGEYNPPTRSVAEGGRTGRMRLLHNGTGHGLTGGGGLNAKGTGGGIKVPQHMRGAQRKLRATKYKTNKLNAMKMADRRRDAEKRSRPMSQQTVGGRPMSPHPVGRFQYGHDQWGFVNQRGLVNWNAGAPKAKMPVIGFNEALPWLRSKGALTKMPTRRAAPAYFQDSLFTRQMAGHQQELNMARAAWEYAKGQQESGYADQLRGLGDQMQASTRDATAGFGGSNLYDSGVADAALGSLAKQFLEAQKSAEINNNQNLTKIGADWTNAETGFNVQKAAETSVAKDRWLAMNPGKKAPTEAKPNTIFTDNGVTKRNNAAGIPQTWTQAKPKAKAKPKTFTDATGKVRPYLGK